MTTKEFLSENRNIVIDFFNSNINGKCNTSLKNFMIKLMNDFNHKVKVLDIYSEKNLYANLFDIQYSIVENNEIGVSYSKPYKENIFLSEASKRQLPSSMR